jgi:hypothetical protein
MPDSPEIRVVTVPVLDMGVGQMLGYESDAALVEAVERDRVGQSPLAREAARFVESQVARAVLFGGR